MAAERRAAEAGAGRLFREPETGRPGVAAERRFWGEAEALRVGAAEPLRA